MAVTIEKRIRWTVLGAILATFADDFSRLAGAVLGRNKNRQRIASLRCTIRVTFLGSEVQRATLHRQESSIRQAP